MNARSELDLAAVMNRLRTRIGTETPRTVTEVEKGMIRQFARAIGATSPCFFDEQYAATTQWGGLIAPPTFVSYFITGHIPDIFDNTLPLPRQLHAEDAVRCERPIRAGDVITAFARYVDVAQKQGKDGPMIFQSADLILEDERTQPVATVRIVAVSF
jgi:acyl dehydratase